MSATTELFCVGPSSMGNSSDHLYADYRKMLENEALDLVKCARNGRGPRCSGHDARAALKPPSHFESPIAGAACGLNYRLGIAA